MRPRNTLLLLLLLICLGVYVYNVEQPQALREATKEKLLDFKPDEITEIVLAAPDREVVLVKSGAAWKITQPIAAAADDVAVKGILSTLSTAEVKKGLDGEVKDLATYGLEKPSTTVTLKAGPKALPVVRIGDAAPIGGSAYALRGTDKKILLTTASVRSGADKSLKDLRDKTILHFSDDSVRKIEVQSEGNDLVLAKGAGDTWTIESPPQHRADVTTVRSYLSTLRSLRATDFPDPNADLATYGLSEPRLRLSLTLGDEGAQQVLLVGGSNDKKEVFVKIALKPEIYTVGEWVGKDLDKPTDDFRDKSLLVLDKDKPTSLEVTRRDGAGYKLTRGADGKWTANIDGPVEQTALAAFVNDVTTLKGYAIAADGVTDLSAYGLEPAAMSVNIAGENGADLGTLLLGQREVDAKREYTATRAGSGTVYLVRDYQYTRLDRSAADFNQKLESDPRMAVQPGSQIDLGSGDDAADEGDDGAADDDSGSDADPGPM